MTEKRLDPWGRGDIEDYGNLFKEFGIEPFDKYREKFQENRYVRRGIIFGQRDYGRIADAIEKKKRYNKSLKPSAWVQPIGEECSLEPAHDHLIRDGN